MASWSNRSKVYVDDFPNLETLELESFILETSEGVASFNVRVLSLTMCVWSPEVFHTIRNSDSLESLTFYWNFFGTNFERIPAVDMLRMVNATNVTSLDFDIFDDDDEMQEVESLLLANTKLTSLTLRVHLVPPDEVLRVMNALVRSRRGKRKLDNIRMEFADAPADVKYSFPGIDGFTDFLVECRTQGTEVDFFDDSLNNMVNDHKNYAHMFAASVVADLSR